MTPEQRAENIKQMFRCEDLFPDYLLPRIAAEIKAAEDAAYKRGVEDAAKVAENAAMQPGAVIHVAEVRRNEPYVTGPEWGSHIARLIRALKSSGPGER